MQYRMPWWLLIASLAHLLFIRYLPVPLKQFWPPERLPADPKSIQVTLKLPPAMAPVDEYANPKSEKSVAVEPLSKVESKPKFLGRNIGKKQAPAETGAGIQRKKQQVSVLQLRQSIRNYQDQDIVEVDPFDIALPEGINAEAFVANAMTKAGYMAQEYDPHGGAHVKRVQVFGREDRCYLLHRKIVEEERVEWEQSNIMKVGWDKKEISCE